MIPDCDPDKPRKVGERMILACNPRKPKRIGERLTGIILDGVFYPDAPFVVLRQATAEEYAAWEAMRPRLPVEVIEADILAGRAQWYGDWPAEGLELLANRTALYYEISTD